MFFDLCVTWMVRFRLKSILVFNKWVYSRFRIIVCSLRVSDLCSLYYMNKNIFAHLEADNKLCRRKEESITASHTISVRTYFCVSEWLFLIRRSKHKLTRWRNQRLDNLSMEWPSETEVISSKQVWMWCVARWNVVTIVNIDLKPFRMMTGLDHVSCGGPFSLIKLHLIDSQTHGQLCEWVCEWVHII